MKPFILLLLLLPLLSQAQDKDRKIEFPDIPGFQTLVCDLHQHTVFSDGSVWPDIRVREALYDGIDAISLTEHIEYQPHKSDIPHPDRNRSFAIAKESAKDKDLIIIHGAEITRSMPPGHSNTLFITDANKLVVDDPIEAFREAKRQGGFTFWNHPHWTAHYPDGVAKLTDMHRQLIEEDLLHGIEVVNEGTYSDEALNIALDNNLAIMGTSDIHGLIDWLFDIPGGGHRPVTLVFASEKSEIGIKNGLVNRRTVAWHNNSLIGKEDFLVPLIQASITVKSVDYPGKSTVANVELVNNSDATFILQNTSEFTLHDNPEVISLAAQSTTTIQVKTLEKKESFDLTFKVLNAYSAPKEHPTIKLTIDK